MTTAQPIHVAEAIAELGRERVLDARRYLDAWSSLSRSGVPVHDVRHVLDRKEVDTSSLQAVQGWDQRGLLCLVGERGLGKSWAAAHWLWGLHKKGRHGKWLACSSWARRGWDDLRADAKDWTMARALVVDDLGAGTSDNRQARDWINGMLLERWGAARPTILISNGSRDDLAGDGGWLDARLVHRMGETGDMPRLVGDNMRRPDTDKLDEHARGPRWTAARELVDMLGCERDTVPTGEHRDGPSRTCWVVGRELMRAPTQEKNKHAVALIGLTEGVGRLAEEKAANDKTPELEGELADALSRMVNSQGASREKVDDIKKQARQDASIADNLERSRHCYDAMAKPLKGTRNGESKQWDAVLEGGQHRRTMSDKPVEWSLGKEGKAKLRALNIRVTGEPGRVRVTQYDPATKRETIKAMSLASECAGWEFAGTLVGSGW